MLSDNSGKLDLKSGIDLLEGLIIKAKLLLENRPTNIGEYAKWNEETLKCLTRIYGPTSPNITTIVEFCSVDPPWPYIKSEMDHTKDKTGVYENYTASCLRDRSRLLGNCVVALKVKLQEPHDDEKRW